MANTLSAISTAVRNVCADGVVDAYDGGTPGDASGDLQVRTSGGTTLLAELTLANPAAGAASSGTATLNAITDDSSADNTGTAALARLRDRANATVHEGTVSTSGEFYNLNTTSITTGDRVACTAMTITAPAS